MYYTWLPFTFSYTFLMIGQDLKYFWCAWLKTKLFTVYLKCPGPRTEVASKQPWCSHKNLLPSFFQRPLWVPDVADTWVLLPLSTGDQGEARSSTTGWVSPGSGSVPIALPQTICHLGFDVLTPATQPSAQGKRNQSVANNWAGVPRKESQVVPGEV